MMYPISFPNFNLTFEINPVAFQLGSFSIYWYGILILSAILVGLFLAKKDDGLFQIRYEDILDFAIIAVMVGILGARMYYVLFNLDFYRFHPSEIWKVNHRRTCYFGRSNSSIVDSFCFLQEKKNLLF